jgi:hypothetical protein
LPNGASDLVLEAVSKREACFGFSWLMSSLSGCEPQSLARRSPANALKSSPRSNFPPACVREGRRLFFEDHVFGTRCECSARFQKPIRNQRCAEWASALRRYLSSNARVSQGRVKFVTASRDEIPLPSRCLDSPSCSYLSYSVIVALMILARSVKPMGDSPTRFCQATT